VALVAPVPTTPNVSLPRPLPLPSMIFHSVPPAPRLRWPLSGTLILLHVARCRDVRVSPVPRSPRPH